MGTVNAAKSQAIHFYAKYERRKLTSREVTARRPMTQHAPPRLGMSIWLALIFECFHAKPRINTRAFLRSPAASSGSVPGTH